MEENSESISLSVFTHLEEEALGEELSLTEVSNTNEILELMVLHEDHEEHPHYDLDLKEEEIFQTIRDKIKAGPKPPIMEAEEKKQGIERQLEDNTKQLNTLIEFGDRLLSNIGALREQADKYRRDMINEKRRELNRRIRQESIEANAKYTMIRSKWSELEAIDDPLEFHWLAEKEKKNVDQLLQTKDELIADCQNEVERLNSMFDDDLAKQNQDLNCFGQMILNQTDLFSKAVQGQIELLEGAVDDEWQYMCLVTKQKWNELNDLIDFNTEKINEIVKAKNELYEKEINKLMFLQNETTRETNLRLEKDAADLQLELRKARAAALINSERLDYNYNVLEHRHLEDITLGNQQKRRVAKIIQKIGIAKYKLNEFLRNSAVKFEKLTTNIEKVHASISELQVKQKAFRLTNKMRFNKVWDVEYKEIKKVFSEVFEIDKILYRTQLAKCWDPIEVDLSDLKQFHNDTVSSDGKESSSEVIELNYEEKQRQAEENKRKEKRGELRFLRNILRKFTKRSKVFFDSRLYSEVEKYAAEEKLLVTVESIFRVFRITDMEKVKVLMESVRPYSYCPNCQKPPRKKIICKMVNNVMCDIPELSEEEKICNDPNPKQKVECTDHYLVIEPVLVLTALREYIESQGTTFEDKEPEVELKEPTGEDQSLSVDKIHEYFKNLKNAMSKERLKSWKAIEHGLGHFEVLLEERRSLDEECMKLSRQNAELRHFIGAHMEHMQRVNAGPQQPQYKC